MTSRPRCSASSAWSTSVTGMPTLANDIAMPPPMVPAPSTAARLISCGLASAGIFAGFATSRSAKKIWRNAFDSAIDKLEERRALARQRSRRSAVRSRRAAPARPPAARAGRPRPRLADFAIKLVEARAARFERRDLFARGRAPATSGRFSAMTRRRNATPAAAGSPSNISSIRPHACASCAVIGSPDRIMPAAVSTPASRGSRCVPPAPGIETELDFRQRHLGIRRGDAEMAGERQLEPAAHRRAEQRRDHRLADASIAAMTSGVVGCLRSSCRIRKCRSRR